MSSYKWYDPHQLAKPIVNTKRQADQFLRVHGVHYNDLITGDHAAAILEKALYAFTDYQRHADIKNLMLKADMMSLKTPWVPQDFLDPEKRASYISDWVFPAKYSREQLDAMLKRGEISDACYEEMVRELKEDSK